MTSPSFECKGAARWSAWAWFGLALVVLAPLPWFGGVIDWVKFTGLPAGFPFLERGFPILAICVVGGLLAAGLIAEVSWPLAGLFVWAGLRAWWHSFPHRSVFLIGLVLLGLLLYRAARLMPDRVARYVVGAFLVGLAFEGVLGAVNAMGTYPWMSWVDPQHVGKPMGLLTHPNYWGSLMALGLPLIWSRWGIPAAVLAAALILRTVSGGPVISAAIGAAVMAWPLFGRAARWGVLGAGVAGTALTMTLHEWRLSGRWEVWDKALREEMWKWPLAGQGIGEWRSWADQWNAVNYRPSGGPGQSFFVTLQAHNEPLQLWFELGLVGVALAALVAWQVLAQARTIWRACPAGVLPGPLWAWGRAPLERAWVAILAVAAVNMLGSPVFHLPGQAALILFAAGRLGADAEALSQGVVAAGRARRFARQGAPGQDGRPTRRERRPADAQRGD